MDSVNWKMHSVNWKKICLASQEEDNFCMNEPLICLERKFPLEDFSDISILWSVIPFSDTPYQTLGMVWFTITDSVII